MPNWWEETFGSAVATAGKGFGKTPEELAEEERKRLEAERKKKQAALEAERKKKQAALEAERKQAALEAERKQAALEAERKQAALEAERKQAALEAQLNAAKTREEAQAILTQNPDLDVSAYDINAMFPKFVPEVKPPEVKAPETPWQEKAAWDLRALQEKYSQYQAVDPYAEIRDPITGMPTVRITGEDQYLNGIKAMASKLGIHVPDYLQQDISLMQPQERRIYRNSLREAYRSLIHYEHARQAGYMPEGWVVQIQEPDMDVPDWDITTLNPEQRAAYLADLKKKYRWDVEMVEDKYGFLRPEPAPSSYKWVYITPGGWQLKPDQVVTPEGQELTSDQAKDLPWEIDRLSREFNETDITELKQYIETSPQEFLDTMRQVDDTPLARAALKRMGLNDEQIAVIYPPETEGIAGRGIPERAAWMEMPEGQQKGLVKGAEVGLKGLEYALKPFEILSEQWSRPMSAVAFKTIEDISARLKDENLSFLEAIFGKDRIARDRRTHEISVAARQEYNKLFVNLMPGELIELKEKHPDLFPPDEELPPYLWSRKKIAEHYEETKEEYSWGVRGATELAFELPLWVYLGVSGASATGLSGWLSQFTARKGAPAMAAKVAQVAISPAVAGEAVIGAGLRYGIVIPVKYLGKGVTKTTGKAFELALDTGLDKWLASQGQRGIYGNRVASYFLRANKNWLHRRAVDNFIRRRAEAKAKKMGEDWVVKTATEDTVNEAKPLLLEAINAVKQGGDYAPMILATGTATERAVPETANAIVGIVDDIISKKIPADKITADYVAKLIPEGITLEKPGTLVKQLQDLGYSLEEAQSIPTEEAWAAMIRASLPEVKPVEAIAPAEAAPKTGEAIAPTKAAVAPKDVEAQIAAIDTEINSITHALSYSGPERRTAKRIAEMHQTRDMLIAEKARLVKETPEVTPKVAKGVPEVDVAKPIPPAVEGMPKVDAHRQAIEKAFSEGKPVPAEVLADYPDLKGMTGTVPTEVTGTMAAEVGTWTPETYAMAGEEVGTPKEPWQMTRKEFYEQYKGEPTEAIAPRVKGVEDITDITEKINKVINSANRAMAAQKLLRKPEQAKRFGAIRDIREDAEMPLEAGKQALAKLKGELPKGQWEEWEALQMTGEELSRLVGNAQRNINISEGEFVRLFEVIIKKLAIGEIPQKNEIKLLRKAFGWDTLPESRRGWTLFLDILNIPRSLLASVDHSMVLRQNILLTTGHPVISAKAAWKTLEKSFSKVSAEELLGTITGDADYAVLKEAGMSFTEWGAKRTKLAKREEEYASSLASYIPWVAWSERLAANFLNLTRLQVGKKGLHDLEALGVVECIGDEVVKGAGSLKQWTKIVNASTGRGELGVLTGAQPYLNSIFFSPKLQAARLQIPYYYAKVLLGAAKGSPGDKYFAKEMTRTIGSFISLGTTFVGLCVLAGGEGEIDPRSSNFGKVKFGNVRLSPFAGFEQYVRLAARLVSGKLETSTGHVARLSDIGSSRWQELGRFTEFKYAPIFSLVHDILEGENVLGEELEFTPKGVGKEAYNRTTSMFVQDMVDAFQGAGVIGLALASPAFFGMGAQTYDDPTPAAQLGGWHASLKRQEDEFQTLMRQGKPEKAHKLNQNNPMLYMKYDPIRNEWYSMSRRELASKYASKVNVIKSEYNKAEETIPRLLGMDEEGKEKYLEDLEKRMDEVAQPGLDWLKMLQEKGE